MAIDSISSATDGLNIATGAAGGELGKDSFMKMLITQMQNQDPMNPMDNAAMTAQLAQFSSLEQMQQLNSQFSLFQQSTTSAISMMTAGKPVTLELSDGSEVSGVLDKVQWSGGETQFVVNGTAYSAGSVRSLRAAVAVPEVAANESGE
jgi:flagellar basal-body rod modification protein FlgD